MTEFSDLNLCPINNRQGVFDGEDSKVICKINLKIQFISIKIEYDGTRRHFPGYSLIGTARFFTPY